MCLTCCPLSKGDTPGAIDHAQIPETLKDSSRMTTFQPYATYPQLINNVRASVLVFQLKDDDFGFHTHILEFPRGTSLRRKQTALFINDC